MAGYAEDSDNGTWAATGARMLRNVKVGQYINNLVDDAGVVSVNEILLKFGYDALLSSPSLGAF
jgi:hypothetical protein